MQLDPSSRRYLTVETKNPDGSISAVTCDINGKPLGNSAFPLQVYTEVGTGKSFVRIAALLPSNQDPASVAQREAILALNPVFCDGDNGAIRGWYVPAPDYTYHAAPNAA